MFNSFSFFPYLFHFRFSSFSVFIPSFNPPFTSSFFPLFISFNLPSAFFHIPYLLIFIWLLHGFPTRTSDLCLLNRALFTDALNTVHTICRKKNEMKWLLSTVKWEGSERNRSYPFRLPSFYISVSILLSSISFLPFSLRNFVEK